MLGRDLYMLFGDTLRTLLDSTGLKCTHLARELGYDVSYISRWLNNEKLPSAKNNGDLFFKIAQFFTDNTDDQTLTSVMNRLRIGNEFHGLHVDKQAEIAAYLLEVYSAQKAAMENQQSQDREENNSLLTKYMEPEYVFSEIRNSLLPLNDNTESVEIYSTIIDYISGSESILQKMNEFFEKENRKMTVMQLLDLENMKNKLVPYCQAVVQSMCDTTNITINFYEASYKGQTDVQMLVVKDCLFLRKLMDPFTNWNYYLVSKEPSLIQDYYYGIRNSLTAKKPVIQKIHSGELSKDNYFVNYMLQGGFKHILTIMHLLYVEPDTLTAILSEKGTIDTNPYFKAGMFKAEKSVVIFKKALLQYIYEGYINLQGGGVEKISKEARIRHLTDLINRLKTFSGFQLTIIEDVNPVLNYVPGMPSIYLGNRTAHVTSYTTIDKSYVFKSFELVNLFRSFHERLENLSDSFAIRGQAVIDFLQNCIEYLKLLK